MLPDPREAADGSLRRGHPAAPTKPQERTMAPNQQKPGQQDPKKQQDQKQGQGQQKDQKSTQKR